MKTETCDSCGNAYPTEQLIEFDGQLLCPDCLSRATLICAHCGTRIWRDENAGDAATPLCQHCYDAHYVTCTRCGRVIHDDDAYYQDDDSDEAMCYGCRIQCRRRGEIEDYYYKPEPVFHGQGPRFFGVELEIDEGGEMDSNAVKIMETANFQDELIYCKHDGSLDDGFEIVTHPMSLDFHQKQMPWAAVLRKAVELGYRSHAANTCGLHIHVSRDAFGVTEAEQDACIARVLYFFEKHWEELLKFSRRTPRQLERWATRYGYKEHPGTFWTTPKRAVMTDGIPAST